MGGGGWGHGTISYDVMATGCGGCGTVFIGGCVLVGNLPPSKVGHDWEWGREGEREREREREERGK